MRRLRVEREARGWSQSELARRSALHPSQISMAEAGRLLLSSGQLGKLGVAFGLRPTEATRLLEEVDGQAVQA